MRFREFILDSERKILLGKSSENNDELVKSAKRNDVLLHTEQPGSPFCNLGENPSEKEVKEAAIYCAKFSQDWRDNKKDVVVHKFLKANASKNLRLKQGTWEVHKIDGRIKVKKAEIIKLERELNETIA